MKSPLHIVLAGIVLVLFTGMVVVGFWAEAYESHSFPTFLFIASFDWLHNFYDHNIRTGGGDTDNFNKIIVIDSNLFPIETSVAGDNEYPDATSRNTTTWNTNSPSLYSPSVNDYFNRSIAVASDYIPSRYLTYQINTTQNSANLNQEGVVMYGARSFMEWAFITDPGNHNIRRYEFKKLPGFIGSYSVGDEESGDFGGSADDGVKGSGIGQNECDTCDDTHWYYVSLETAFSKKAVALAGLQESYWNDVVYYFPRGASYDHPTVPEDFRPLATQQANPVLELIITLQEDEIPDDGKLTLPVSGNSADQSSANLYVGLNAGYDEFDLADPHPGVTDSQIVTCDAGIASGQEKDCAFLNPVTDAQKSTQSFTFTGISSAWDLDSNVFNGIQLRLSIFPQGKGGFIIDTIGNPEDDSAFAVKREDGTDIALRWDNITSFMETLPKKSFPGYPSYTSPATRHLGYGSDTNTTFDTADNVRFKNPRDIDVYRDHFDSANEGPVYIFVADTTNSRIQVFMNATGSAGESNAEFPIRPVRVKGPNDSSTTAYNSNELGRRVYDSSGNSTGFGDGRKADWRHYTTVSGDTLANSRVPADAGRGEFFYPHGIAVDQDPNTKDVYLFVADTFNHRIQVFRDLSGVSSQAITDKRFDFQYEEGWGTYPLQTTQTITAPGPFHFRYPKGIDVARVSNDELYLYVVDSKDFRLMKYKITEDPNGGISTVEAVAGYGYDGSDFVDTLANSQGVPLEAHRSFEANGSAAIGFLNPQEVSTGYNGFYTYSGPPFSTTQHYQYEIERDDSPTLKQGVKYLNNYMIYVTDYARNNTTIVPERVNMRVLQFVENLNGKSGNYLPWQTETVEFDKGKMGQSALGEYGGVYHSEGYESVIPYTGTDRDKHTTGATENVPGRNAYYTDRPVGIDSLTWDTVTPFDIRVVELSSSTIFPNGTTIDKDTQLRIGARARGFFGFPQTDITTYTNYTAERFYLDGKYINRVHVVCYDDSGAFQGHTALPAPPYNIIPNSISSSCTGYMKVIAEDKHFAYSGKTGTKLFKMKP